MGSSFSHLINNMINEIIYHFVSYSRKWTKRNWKLNKKVLKSNFKSSRSLHRTLSKRRRHHDLGFQFYKHGGKVKPRSQKNSASNVDIQNNLVPVGFQYECPGPSRETNHNNDKEFERDRPKLPLKSFMKDSRSPAILHHFTLMRQSLIASKYVKEVINSTHYKVDDVVNENISISNNFFPHNRGIVRLEESEDIMFSGATQSSNELPEGMNVFPSSTQKNISSFDRLAVESMNELSTVKRLDTNLELILESEEIKEKKFDVKDTNDIYEAESSIIQEKVESHHLDILLSSGIQDYDNNSISEKIFEDFFNSEDSHMDSFIEISEVESIIESSSNTEEKKILLQERDEYDMVLSLGDESPIKQRFDFLCNDSIDYVSEGSHPHIKIGSSIDIEKLYTTSLQLTSTKMKNLSSDQSLNFLGNITTEVTSHKEGTLISIKDIPYVNEDYFNEGCPMEIKDLLDEIPSSNEIVINGLNEEKIDCTLCSMHNFLKEDMRLHYVDHYGIEISRNYKSFKVEDGSLTCRICFKTIDPCNESRHYGLDHDVIRLYVTNEIYNNFFV